MAKYTIKEIQIGNTASQTMTITQEYVETFGRITNDLNPMHFDEAYANKTMFQKRIAHGMYVGSLFSKLFGLDLPGEGTIYVSQSLRFKRPVYFGDTITATVTVTEKNEDRNRVFFQCVATNQDGDVVITGDAEVMPPKEETTNE
jgi:acyl dehydratase